MSFHSKNYGLEPAEKQFKSWVGDGALTFIARLVLFELYPFLPIKLLMAREERIKTNKNLTAYCKRKNLPFGCNHLEIKIYELIFNNQINEAKEIILDIINQDSLIKQMDIHQISNGQLKENIKIDLINKYKTRELLAEKHKVLAEKHKAIRNLDLSQQDKKELHKSINLYS